MSLDRPLTSEFQYYLANQDEIVKKYDGQFVVIKNRSIIGAYNNEIQAVEESKKSHELGTFLVQHVSPGKDEYTEVFHSRVVFN